MTTKTNDKTLPKTSETVEQTDKDLVSADHFGGCPSCGRNDGFRNIRRSHWFYCLTHLTCWCAGENLFSNWRSESTANWKENKAFLRDFQIVEPVYGSDAERKSHGKHESGRLLPIVYHPGVSDRFDFWAEGCRMGEEELRQATTQAIRCRHQEALPARDDMTSRPDSLDILRLSLGTADVYYSVEADSIVIRGYGWEIDHPPLDDHDGGGFFSEPEK